MKYIQKKSTAKIPEINGAVVDTRNIDNKTKNTYSARVIEEELIETITNENGTAIKFPDGTMICKNTFMANCEMITAMSSGGYRSGGYSVVYPQEFIEKPDVVAMSSSGAIDNGVIVEAMSDATTNAQFVFVWWSMTKVTTSQSHYMTYTAIGRWK